jgi:arylsulfatase A-like enzyme
MSDYLNKYFPFIKRSARITLFIAYFYIFFEWMYCLSKSSSSYMYMLGWPQRIEVLFVDGLVLTLLALLFFVIVCLLHFLLTLLFPKFGSKLLLSVPPALIIASVILIAVDNFTYTVFHFGIVTTTNALRLLYAAGFLAILYFAAHFLSGLKSEKKKSKGKTIKWISAAALLVVSFSFVIYGGATRSVDLTSLNADDEKASSKPNVIFLSTDGLNAAEMSIYGYQKETTPYLDSISSTLLIGENNFTNVGHTTGSIISMLTSKSAFETKVLFPPDILRGSNIFESLPAILKDQGYRSIQVGVPYYVDGNSQNFQNAFDSVNCEEYPNLRYKINKATGYKFDDEVYLLYDVQTRISQRLLHIFYIKNMVNPSKVVNQMSKFADTDADRMNCLIQNLEQSKENGQPLFAQMHLMVTHGPYFYPKSDTFSSGEKESTTWMDDFVADAVVDFDNNIKQLVTYLQESGQYDNTILVIYSDHGQHWTTYRKTPMILHFPNDEYAGTLTTNTQNIDAAPTILDYMGMPKPSWMEGDSMLTDLDPTRILITANTNRQAGSETGLVAVPASHIVAPFYQFSEMTAVQCQYQYIFNFDKLTVTKSTIYNYVGGCPAEDLDSIENIISYGINQLKSFGYDAPADWKY